jgi:hypothetical protein
VRVDIVLWLLLAALLSVCGVLTLRACDLGPMPLFGGRYCAAAAQRDALAAERARARDLEERIREAELRIAEKPACAQPQEPEKRREPPPAPIITPTVPPIPPEQQLTVPKKISELKGCWESIRGDLDIVSDDEERRLIGKVRECYCFGARGVGEFRMSYSDGAKCRAPITAELDGDVLKIQQPRFHCVWKGQNRGLVPAEIVCHGAGGEGEAASCEYEYLGRIHSKGVEQYRRVPLGHCG